MWGEACVTTIIASAGGPLGEPSPCIVLQLSRPPSAVGLIRRKSRLRITQTIRRQTFPASMNLRLTVRRVRQLTGKTVLSPVDGQINKAAPFCHPLSVSHFWMRPAPSLEAPQRQRLSRFRHFCFLTKNQGNGTMQFLLWAHAKRHGQRQWVHAMPRGLCGTSILFTSHPKPKEIFWNHPDLFNKRSVYDAQRAHEFYWRKQHQSH